MSSPTDNRAGVYIHFPYCIRKCSYCDFCSHPLENTGVSVDDYIDALIEDVKSIDGKPDAGTLFIGGGTPSLIPANALAEVIAAVRERFTLPDNAEISIEANPGTVHKKKMQGYRNAGINRISIGVQSFNENHLQTLGRIHDRAAAIDALSYALEIFPSAGLDLMYGIPGQAVDEWKDDLKKAVALCPHHISAYELTPEEGTPLGEAMLNGRVEAPDEDDAVMMFHTARKMLTAAGYVHYEISNYAMQGRQCRHNLKYWIGTGYYGFGASAASYLNRWRIRRISDPHRYANAIKTGRAVYEFAERLSTDAAMAEFMMLALRKTTGVSAERFQRLFDKDLFDVYGDVIKDLKLKGLVKIKKAGADTRVFIPGEKLVLQSEAALGFLDAALGGSSRALNLRTGNGGM